MSEDIGFTSLVDAVDAALEQCIGSDTMREVVSNITRVARTTVQQEDGAPNILLRATDHLVKRGQTYDTPGGERSMASAVEAFNGLTGLSLREEHGWLLLVLVKMRRLLTAPGFHSDSAEDGAAYAALMGEAIAKRVAGS